MKDHNKTQLTEQKPGGKTYFIPLVAPRMTLRVDWSGERVDSPVTPPPTDLGGNVEILGEHDDWGSVQPGDDGVTLVYSRRGTCGLSSVGGKSHSLRNLVERGNPCL